MSSIRDSKRDAEQLQLLERLWHTLEAAEMKVASTGPLIEALILAYGMTGRFDDALWVFNMIHGPTGGPCLRAMLSACSLATPPRWETALDLLHTSDVIEGGGGGPAGMDFRALAFAIITCAKADQWEEALTILDLYGVPAST